MKIIVYILTISAICFIAQVELKCIKKTTTTTPINLLTSGPFVMPDMPMFQMINLVYMDATTGMIPLPKDEIQVQPAVQSTTTPPIPSTTAFDCAKPPEGLCNEGWINNQYLTCKYSYDSDGCFEQCTCVTGSYNALKPLKFAKTQANSN